MELQLATAQMYSYHRLPGPSLSQEESMEMIVPDALPDIKHIVDTDATVFLKGKSTDNGYARISGMAHTTILYCPDNSTGIRRLTADIPFTVTAENTAITQDTRLTAVVRLEKVESTVINPRKIVIHLVLRADMSCYNGGDHAFVVDIDEPESTGIELKKESLEITAVTSIKEKAFVITDELTLPSGQQSVGEIHKETHQLRHSDAKIVGSKLILRGTVWSTLLYTPLNGGDLTSVDISTEYSQIVELDGPLGDSSIDVLMMATDAFIDPEPSSAASENRCFVLELHAVAQCVLSENKTVVVISDMYSTKFALSHSYQEAIFSSISTEIRQGVCQDILDSTKSVNRVVTLTVHSGPIVRTLQHNKTLLSVPLWVNALYITDDGDIMSTNRQLNGEVTGELLDGDLVASCTYCGQKITSVVKGNSIEVRVPVEVNVSNLQNTQLKILSGVQYEEGTPVDNSKAPSLVACRFRAGDTLWDLAKKHQSTARLIEKANDLEGQMEANVGQLLIIPQKR